MARIKQITSKNEIPDEHHGIFDSIASSRGRISGTQPRGCWKSGTSWGVHTL